MNPYARTTTWWRRDVVPAPARTDLQVEHLADEAIVFDPRSGKTFRLNPTADRILRWCDGEVSVSEIAARLAGTYDVDPETALDDVEQLVCLFTESDLLETGDRS